MRARMEDELLEAQRQLKREGYWDDPPLQRCRNDGTLLTTEAERHLRLCDLCLRRIDSVRRRWEKSKKPCARCGHNVLWRKEQRKDGSWAKRCLDQLGRRHVCLK